MDGLTNEEVKRLMELYDPSFLEANPIFDGRNVKCKKQLMLFLRNRLIVLGNLTMGWRRNEIRTVLWKDVWNFDTDSPKEELYRAPNKLKRKTKIIRDENGNIIERKPVKMEGRSTLLTKKVKEWLTDYKNYYRFIWDEPVEPQHYLFRSFKARNAPLTNMMIHNIVKSSFDSAGIYYDQSRKLGTHSLRKTYARNIYEKTDRDINVTARLLGHKNVNSTMSYLAPRIDKSKYDMDTIF